MTSAYADPPDELTVHDGVYAPQHDSELLTEVLEYTGLAREQPGCRPVHG